MILKQNCNTKEAKFDTHLRKFEHAKALDEATRPFYRNRPEVPVAVLAELQRRHALKPALAGRDEKQLARVISFICRYLGDARFAELLIEVASEILGNLSFLFLFRGFESGLSLYSLNILNQNFI